MRDPRQLVQFYINLTPRQREAVYWTLQGLTNRQIARRMVIAPSVVAGHLSSIYAQLSAFEGTEQANRYTVIRCFAGFFEQHPELVDPSW
jgi:DNA-binding CsgD family transcriptional regulator